MVTESYTWMAPFSVGKSTLPEEVAVCLQRGGMIVRLTEAPGGEHGPGIILLDELSPEACQFVRDVSRDGERRILVLVSDSTFESGDAWQVLQAGASDLLAVNENSGLAAPVRARLQRWQEVDRLLDSSTVRKNLVGKSRVWKGVLRNLIEAACFTEEPLLLMGETGTGKELAARLIHTLDQERKRRDLVILDCTTIVPDLAGSELFGHERGAFTGAVRARDGAFAMADQGTLFLDEIGELPLELQVQLLRVLQEGTYKRVGGNVWRKADFRLLCATNRDLQSEVQAGRFRRDLYYRIASWTVRMPPLRERPDDILPLVQHFLAEAGGESEAPQLDPRVKQYFLCRSYPGNVRDLKNLVYRVASRHVGSGHITMGDIPPDEWPDHAEEPVTLLVKSIEPFIRLALLQGVGWRIQKEQFRDLNMQLAVECSSDNLKEAARLLGVDVRTLQYWRKNQ